ncbi:uncharacterized protein B0I36DRAFT_334827 [Microdochium trichocladiopsis]|uniref:Uncharacterized protein n=1 Tax=Microdochium trichocladiopsis TaxID=1682393 RepID=A0A9P9BIH7_9PEZI|nr:uncharacterized protein B0I36DRAFT_334827 [Microdochium trichocladiopsis]KAH7021595.1 hypothetical protein B0I36DRAFT_334827 [Microdochium trichocladiopsis]
MQTGELRAGPVVGSVTTSESPVLYVLSFSFLGQVIAILEALGAIICLFRSQV